MPTHTIGLAVKEIVQTQTAKGKPGEEAKLLKIMPACGLMVLQGAVFFALLVCLDRRHTTSYKGKDRKRNVVERLQLEEKEDVIRHRLMSNDIWDQAN